MNAKPIRRAARADEPVRTMRQWRALRQWMSRFVLPLNEGRGRRSLWRAWLAWRQCPRSERRAWAGSVALIPILAASVRLIDFQRTLRWAERTGCRPEPVSNTSDVIREAVRAIARARLYSPFPGTCLSRSLALLWLLRRNGVPATLRLGARVEDGRFCAHAWVEYQDRVLNDAPDVASRFSPFAATSLCDLRGSRTPGNPLHRT